MSAPLFISINLKTTDMKKSFLFLIGVILSMSGFAYDFEVDGIYYTITSLDELTVEVANSSNLETKTSNYEGDITIPSTVLYKEKTFSVIGIGDAAFCYYERNPGSTSYGTNKNLTSVSLPSSIIYINFYAFFGCMSLKKIEMPENITTIGGGAFENCQTLKEIYLGNQVKELIDDCFAGCSSLESIIIPETVSKIGYRAFQNCTSLSMVNIPEKVTSLGERTFYKCTSLKSIEIPSSVNSIGYGVFEGCTSITKFEIPEGVSSIASYAFKDCSSLLEVTLPSTLNTIQVSTFEGCTKLTTVTSKIRQPYDIDGSNFPNHTYLFGKLIVPAGMKNLYMQHKGWINFSNIEESTSPDEHFYEASISCSNGGRILCLGVEIINGYKKFSIKESDDLTFQIIPDEGYRLVSLTVGENDVTNMVTDGIYTVKNVEADINIYASFEEIPIALTIQHAENGYLKQFVQRGANIKFALVPAEGWKINSVVYNGYDVTSELNNDNEYTTPAINADAILSVSFESTQSAVSSARISYAKVYGSNGEIVISGIERGDAISVYDEGGKIIAQTVANGNEQRIAIPAKGIYIVKTGEKTVKVCL